MKKTYFRFALAAVALASVSAFAQGQASNPVATLSGAEVATPAVASPYKFDVGLVNYFEVYEEQGARGKVMQEDAPMVGVQASVSRAFGSGHQMQLSLEYATGKSDYTGSFQGGNYGDVKSGGIKREKLELVGLGKSAPGWNHISVVGGVGYRELKDSLGAITGGYNRKNTLWYGILGLEREFKLDNWTVTPAAQYKFLLSGKQNSDLQGGIENTQNTGSGAELSLTFAQRHGDYRVAIKPFVRTWDIADSTVNRGMYEPKNKTTETGLAVSVLF